MKMTMLYVAGLLFACLGSGFVGAYLAVHMKEKPPPIATVWSSDSVIQAKGLELVDGSKNVRARFALEDNGDVSLVMNSSKMAPIVALREIDVKQAPESYTPEGELTILDGLGTRAIDMGTVGDGEGTLMFSSSKIHGQVAVGYQRYGDTSDDSLANWGIQVRGPDHNFTGVGVRTKDNMPQEFLGPAK
ncbi:hypothetical protein [Granulicella sp. S156]|uniref:hypothetical protein n=1 Tax=Granulicella sp. S156 TaxID=1747224 RepID=UPI00131CCF53|nr:hypothetical protein [Granulicella sp. S156]